MSIHAAPYATIVAPLARTGRATTSSRLVFWAGLSRAERLATIAIVTGGVVAIITSTTWAWAVNYMVRQQARSAQLPIQEVSPRLPGVHRADLTNRPTTRSAGN